MAFSTAGLPNGGLTQFYAITYDDTLPFERGLDAARQLMAVCDDDYYLLTTWFRGAVSMPAQRLPVKLGATTGGAMWWGWGPVYEITLHFGDAPTTTSPVSYGRFLLVSEVSEIFMRQRQFVPNHWFSVASEGNKGEALSCFLAAELLRVINEARLPAGFFKAGLWLDSARSNFLNVSDGNITPDAEIGCGINFLNFLRYQRGASIEAIIEHGADTLDGVFANLGFGAQSGAFATFRGLVDSHYAQDPRMAAAAPDLDSVFPLPELNAFITAPQASWNVSGLSTSMVVGLTRRAPMDVLVMFTSDRPDILDVPADLILRQHALSGQLSFTVKSQPVGFTKADVTLTATYAGHTMTRLVTVYAPAQWPMPPLQVVPETPPDLCASIFTAGSAQRVFVRNLEAFPDRIGLAFTWIVRNATGTAGASGDFTFATLPAAGTVVDVTVTARNAAGVHAEGQLSFTTQAAPAGLQQEVARLNCRIAHIVDIAKRIPRLPVTKKQVIPKERLAEVEQRVNEVAQLTAEVMKQLQKLSVRG